MTNKQLFGISLALVMILGSVTPAFAGFEPLRVQLEQGIESDKLQCNNPNHVLVLRTNGNMVCVTDRTAEKLSWEIIHNLLEDNLPNDVLMEFYEQQNSLNRFTTIFDTKISLSNYDSKNNDGLSEIGDYAYYWPKFHMTLPEQVKIGESFDVVLNYTYVIPDEDTGNYAEPEEQCISDHYCKQQDIWITIPAYVDYLNEDAIFESTFNDTKYVPTRVWNAYSIDPSFDNTKPLQETFTFVVNKPDIDYQYGSIDISFHGSKEAIFHFNAAQDGIVYFDDKEMRSLGEGPEQLQDAPITGNIITREERLAAGPTDGPPKEIWGLFKDHLLKQHSLGFHSGQSIREVLYSTNIKHSWTDQFLKFYPELDVQSFSPVLNWILPQAFGVEVPTSFIFGKISNTDPDGGTSFVHGVKVCAYDTNDSNTFRSPLTINNQEICSKTTNVGTFTFYVPIIDINGSGTPDVAVRVITDNSDIIIYKNNNRNLTFVDSVDTNKNIDPNNQNIGIIDISKPNQGVIPKEHQAFWAFENLVNINEWYNENLTIHPDKIDVIYDPDVCRGVGIDPDSHILTLGPDSSPGGRDCPNTVHAPISNTDTLAHEYAHFVFLETLDELESDYPITTDFTGIHTPVHLTSPGNALVEGWAFFMAIAYSGTPVYQPVYMAGQWNFETRTHNEETHDDIVGKMFAEDSTSEGSVAAALWDMIDIQNESGDDLQNQLENIWDAFDDPLETGETITAGNILQFRDDWNDENFSSLDNVFQLNTITIPGIDPPPSSGTVYLDDFEDGMSDWTLTSDGIVNWESVTWTNYPAPDEPSGNKVAVARNCDNTCTMTLTSGIDLSSLEDATLKILRNIDRSLDSGEGTTVEISKNGGSTWTQVFDWTVNSGEDDRVWHQESFTLDSSYLVNNFKIRIIGISSSFGEENIVDNIKIASNSAGPPPVLTPNPVVDLSFAFNSDNTQVTLSWSKPSGNPVTSYKLDTLRPHQTEWITINPTYTSTSYTQGVTQGYDYSFRVFAKNNAGLSPVSNIASFTVPDITSPTLRLLGDNPTTINVGIVWSEPGGIVSDNVDTLSFANDVTISGTVDHTTAGNYVVSYVVFDKSRNFAEYSRTVNVVDVTSPTGSITYSTLGPYTTVGDNVIITATFSEPVKDSPVPQISISGSNVVSFTNMTKTSSTVYTYLHIITEGNGTATVSLSAAQDLAGNPVTTIPAFGATFTVNAVSTPTGTLTSIPSLLYMGSIPISNTPSGLAANSTHIITIDGNMIKVLQNTTPYNTLQTISSANDIPFDNPHDVEIIADNILISDTGNSRIVKLDKSGNYLSSITEKLITPKGLSSDGVFIAVANQYQDDGVNVYYLENGNYLGTLLKLRGMDGTFTIPSDVHIGNSLRDMTVVTRDGLHHYDSQSRSSLNYQYVGGLIQNGMDVRYFTSVDVDSKGRIYLTSDVTGSLYRLDPATNHVSSITRHAIDPIVSTPIGVTISDDDGMMYVSDISGKIHIFKLVQ